MFTEKERDYLNTQPLARLATVAGDGQPDVAAVGYRFNGATFLIGGHNLKASRKFKNVAGGRRRVALIIDDLASVKPWRPRGIRIYGVADSVETDGQFGPGDYLRITPLISWSWGLEGESWRDGQFTPHKTIHDPEPT